MHLLRASRDRSLQRSILILCAARVSRRASDRPIRNRTTTARVPSRCRRSWRGWIGFCGSLAARLGRSFAAGDPTWLKKGSSSMPSTNDTSCVARRSSTIDPSASLFPDWRAASWRPMASARFGSRAAAIMRRRAVRVLSRRDCGPHRGVSLAARDGILAEEDFREYQAQRVEAVCARCRDCELFTPPPPSGGITSLAIVQTVEAGLGLDHSAVSWNAGAYHAFAEAAKICWRERQISWGIRSSSTCRFANIDLRGNGGIACTGEFARRRYFAWVRDRSIRHLTRRTSWRRTRKGI